MAKRKLTPTERDIIRSLIGVKLRVTPSKIAKTINVHPTTVQKKIQRELKKITDCTKRGNRTMCKLKPNWKKKLRDDFFFGD